MPYSFQSALSCEKAQKLPHFTKHFLTHSHLRFFNVHCIVLTFFLTCSDILDLEKNYIDSHRSKLGIMLRTSCHCTCKYFKCIAHASYFKKSCMFYVNISISILKRIIFACFGIFLAPTILIIIHATAPAS